MLTDDFISYIRGVRRYSARTQEIYASALEDFVKYINGNGQQASDGQQDNSDRRITESLTSTFIRNYEVYLMDERKMDSRTVNLHLSVLSSFCKYLVYKELLKSNPVSLISRPKCEKRLPAFYRQESMEEYFETSSPSAGNESLEELKSEARALQQAGKDSSVYKVESELYNRRLKRIIISLLYNTGIRRSELISLRIKDIDSHRSVIHVRGKGDKMREIPLISSLYKEISLYLDAVETIAGRVRTPDEPLLVTFTGKKLYPVYVDRAVKSELGGVEGITGRKSPHVLRHTLATELLNDGADLYSIKELLGHASLAATQVYTHNTIEKLKSVYLNAHPRAKRGGKNGD